MGVIALAAACGHFHHDRERNLARVAAMVTHARDAGTRLLVLPHATLGGHVGDDVDAPARTDALHGDDAVFDRIAALAREMVVCLGYLEVDGDRFHGSAVCLHGDGVLGRHREVHPPPVTADAPDGTGLTPGERLAAFDTPVGRIGMLVDHDKTFPETARSLAVDGAVVLAVLSAWQASVPRRTATLVHDPQSRLFDLYDQARAAENQVVVLSSNQSGGSGRQRFVGSAKVVGPHGEVLATTGARGGLAVAALDVAYEVARARAVRSHLAERRPAVYDRTSDSRS